MKFELFSTRSLLALLSFVAAQQEIADLFVEPSARASAMAAVHDLQNSMSESSDSSSAVPGTSFSLQFLNNLQRFYFPNNEKKKKKKLKKKKKKIEKKMFFFFRRWCRQ